MQSIIKAMLEDGGKITFNCGDSDSDSDSSDDWDMSTREIMERRWKRHDEDEDLNPQKYIDLRKKQEAKDSEASERLTLRKWFTEFHANPRNPPTEREVSDYVNFTIESQKEIREWQDEFEKGQGWRPDGVIEGCTGSSDLSGVIYVYRGTGQEEEVLTTPKEKHDYLRKCVNYGRDQGRI